VALICDNVSTAKDVSFLKSTTRYLGVLILAFPMKLHLVSQMDLAWLV